MVANRDADLIASPEQPSLSLTAGDIFETLSQS
jgi:Uma2 family endonuclease